MLDPTMRRAAGVCAWTTALVVFASCASTRPAPPRVLEPTSDEPGPAVVVAPPMSAETDPVATPEPSEGDLAREPERRHGKAVTLEPPAPPRDDYEIWGGVTGSTIDDSYGVAGRSCTDGPLPSAARTRHGRRPVVHLRSIAVTGGLSRDDAAVIFTVKSDDIGACQLAAMEEQPQLAGRLRLAVEIAPDGRVRAAAADGLEVIAGCVRAAALGWQFSPARHSSHASGEYELRTEPAPPERSRSRCRR